MKFSVDRVTLQRMVTQLKVERGIKALPQRMMRILACAGRVFVEANGVTAGVEALVLQEGACSVPRMKFLKVLRTFAPKPIVIVSADENGLRIENFVMEVTCFSPTAVPPGEFRVFPVTDAWLAQAQTTKLLDQSESRFPHTR